MQIGMIVGVWILITFMIMIFRFLYAYILLTKNSDDWAEGMIRDIRSMMKLPIQYHYSIQNGEKIKLVDRGAEAVWEA